MMNKKPQSCGNASVITEQELSLSRFAMIRYEDIFDYYSEEPASITIKTEKEKEKEVYSPILRIRFWNQENQSYSWNVYSDDRERLKNLIIRKVVWNMDKDKEYMKEHIKKERKNIMTSWPSIVNRNKFIYFSDNRNIAQKMNDLDRAIENGFLLCENAKPSEEWRDLEILRLFDWGQIHFTWCTHKRNECVEKKIKSLIAELDTSIENYNHKVFSMSLNYNMIPEKYKKIYIDNYYE